MRSLPLVGVGSGNLLASLILHTFLFTGFLSTTISAKDSLHQTIATQNQVEVSDSTSHSMQVFQSSIDNSKLLIQNVKLSTISTFHLWNNDPIKSMAIRASGQWDELSILVEPVIVNEPYGPDILGVDYTRAGVSGRITNAFVRYENDQLAIQLGRAPVAWGSIISSGVTALPLTSLPCEIRNRVENISSGSPVVMIANGEPADIVNTSNCGIVVHPGNIDGIVNAVETLIDDKDLRNEMGKNGFSEVKKNFNRQDILNKFHNYIITKLNNEDNHFYVCD